MRLSKRYLVCMVASCFCIQQGTAQINMVYSMGVVGSVDAKQPVYSGAVIVDGNKACFNLASGAKTFAKPKEGLFDNNCLENHASVRQETPGTVVKLNLSVFPNPVVTTVTVKSLDLLQIPDAVMVTVYGINGQLIKTAKTNFSELGRGLMMDLSGVRNGVYVLKVSSPSASAEFKLIKVD
ncbi:MAG: T9SS type A sorting domain-containing protein [Bacteroidota bacterium]